MIFEETKLQGAYVVSLEPFEDERGRFARTFCQREFAEHGLESNLVQANLSYNFKRGTLRGMHYQTAPYEETKLIRCTHGALYDVIVDLREDSPTYREWFGIELTDENYKMLYVPQNFAHGFVTLEEDTEAIYFTSQFYAPGAEKGLRWNDPAFGIQWPVEIEVISEKDGAWPDFPV